MNDNDDSSIQEGEMDKSESPTTFRWEALNGHHFQLVAPVTAGWREKTKAGLSQVSYPLRFCGISLGSLEIRLCPSHLIILQACGTDLHKTHI